jgi:hypothetical protein
VVEAFSNPIIIKEGRHVILFGSEDDFNDSMHTFEFK